MVAMKTKDKVFMLAREVHSTIRQAGGSSCCLQFQIRGVQFSCLLLLASVELMQLISIDYVYRHVTQETTPTLDGRGIPTPDKKGK